MRLLLLFALLAPTLARAQTPGTCTAGTATALLNVGDVSARLYTGGNLFLNQTSGAPEYVVPRASGGRALFAAGLWVGATVGGVTRVAAAKYGPDFWPGPLGAAAAPPADCSVYDRIYVVTTADVAAYEAGGVPAADLAAWPVGLGAEARTASGRLVVPTSRGQVVNLAAGERPVVLGGQTAFWVMNDVGNAHTRGSAPLGIEVQVTASAFQTGALALRQSTAYRFRIVNRNAVPLESAYATFFVDTNIGSDTPNQRQGVDVPRGLAFTYNRNPTSVPYGVSPAVGYDFLNTGLGAHRYALNGTFDVINDPNTTQGVYNAMQGLWNDGTPQTAMGGGYQTQGAVTRYAFPADPVTAQFWSAENTDGQGGTAVGGNSRSMPSTPAFRLEPGASVDVAVAVLFAQGADRLDSVTRLRAASDLVQTAYDAGTLLPTASDDAPPVAAAGVSLGAPQPNPARDGLSVTVAVEGTATLRMVDVLGRTVLERPLAAGTRDARVDTQRLAPGVYALVLDAGTARATRTVTVVR